MAKAWDGRFKESNAPLFEKMNKSLDFDIRMFKQDIKLNKIYSKELCRIGLISQEDLKDIESGLSQVEKDIEENGINAFEDNVEDIHMG
ncbi:MAG TPA: lyase family protein, partial [Spirochaetota bacterium]|nr:lyase family protein [Spirochaetota bacterium]